MPEIIQQFYCNILGEYYKHGTRSADIYTITPVFSRGVFFLFARCQSRPVSYATAMHIGLLQTEKPRMLRRLYRNVQIFGNVFSKLSSRTSLLDM